MKPSIEGNDATARAEVKVELVCEGSYGWDYLRYSCRNCGKVVSARTKHCASCGVELDWKRIIVKEVDYSMTCGLALVISLFACALTFLSCK